MVESSTYSIHWHRKRYIIRIGPSSSLHDMAILSFCARQMDFIEMKVEKKRERSRRSMRLAYGTAFAREPSDTLSLMHTNYARILYQSQSRCPYALNTNTRSTVGYPRKIPSFALQLGHWPFLSTEKVFLKYNGIFDTCHELPSSIWSSFNKWSKSSDKKCTTIR